MNRRFICFPVYFTTILLFAYGCQKPNFTNYEELVSRSNNIMKSYDKKAVKVFAEISDNKYELIKDLSNWNKEYLSILNIYENGNEKIARKIIESEDYTCINTSYYNKNGGLMVLILEISFFNSVCTEDLLNKTTRIYFDGKKELYRKDLYENEDGILLTNTKECVDNYNCTFRKNYYFKNIPI